ncbi:MAG: SDR family NAD(P)-dependent oxidoreductase [Hyphomicrobiaceae bacterium]|nr:SDR family NAD(P)-dependent oxidoreductase [Hyphomicrobiaceae bacterium]MCC0023889.1 SDR family NAD(P)-dependent oxidoreductase [Hyphomicrobiaceae bacterium]
MNEPASNAPDLTRRTIIVTGASDGIGAAAARSLTSHGHEVVIVGRSPDKTRAVAAETGAEFHIADFARLDEVRDLARELDQRHERIDVLANNAGGIFGERKKTVDGFELTFQVNHLAPFLLTSLLLPKLIAGRASIIQTSSIGARFSGKIDIDDLDMDRNYSAIRAYMASKLENVLFTRELHRRYHAEGISAAAFHPGNIASGFGAHTQSRLMRLIATNPIFRAVAATPEQGAQQLVWLAEGMPGRDWESGAYYERGKPASRENPQAREARLAEQLWERSAQLVGMANKQP